MGELAFGRKAPKVGVSRWLQFVGSMQAFTRQWPMRLCVCVYLTLHPDGPHARLKGVRPHEGEAQGAQGEGRHTEVHDRRAQGSSSVGETGLQERTRVLHGNHA